MEAQAATAVAAWANFADSVQQQVRRLLLTLAGHTVCGTMIEGIFCPVRSAHSRAHGHKSLQQALVGCKTSVQMV